MGNGLTSLERYQVIGIASAVLLVAVGGYFFWSSQRAATISRLDAEAKSHLTVFQDRIRVLASEAEDVKRNLSVSHIVSAQNALKEYRSAISQLSSVKTSSLEERGDYRIARMCEDMLTSEYHIICILRHGARRMIMAGKTPAEIEKELCRPGTFEYELVTYPCMTKKIDRWRLVKDILNGSR